MTLEEDFALLLDFAELLETDEEDFTELLLDFAELLDATLEEDFALLLDFALDDVGESQSSQTDEEESSASGLTKLPLSSSPHAAKNANTAPTANNLANFMFLPQIISPKYNQKPVFIKLAKLSPCSRA